MMTRLFLIMLKYTPAVSALFCMANSLLAYAGIAFDSFRRWASLSILAIIGLYIASWTFRFCKYHRLLLWYLLFNNILVPHIEVGSMKDYHQSNWYVGTAVITMTIAHVANTKTTASKDCL